MKEIKILIRNLREYPDNFFVYPVEEGDEDKSESLSTFPSDGLVICDMDGVQQGFIEIGGKGSIVIK